MFFRPRTSPGSLLPFYFTALAVELLSILSAGLPQRARDICHYVAFTAAFCCVIVILAMRLRNPSLPVADISPVGDIPSNKTRSPEDNLRLWQFLSIYWMNPLITLGKKRTLNEEDVWRLAYEFQHKIIYERFRVLQGTVVKRLLKANGLDICILTMSTTVGVVAGSRNWLLKQRICANLLIRVYSASSSAATSGLDGETSVTKARFAYLCVDHHGFPFNLSPG